MQVVQAFLDFWEKGDEVGYPDENIWTCLVVRRVGLLAPQISNHWGASKKKEIGISLPYAKCKALYIHYPTTTL